MLIHAVPGVYEDNLVLFTPDSFVYGIKLDVADLKVHLLDMSREPHRQYVSEREILLPELVDFALKPYQWGASLSQEIVYFDQVAQAKLNISVRYALKLWHEWEDRLEVVS